MRIMNLHGDNALRQIKGLKRSRLPGSPNRRPAVQRYQSVAKGRLLVFTLHDNVSHLLTFVVFGV